MESVLFRFGEIDFRRLDDYILQWVRNRRLTDVYHSHDFYEIIWFIRGRARQTVNGTEGEYSEGDVLILRPGDSHCFSEQTPETEVVSLSVRCSELDTVSGAYDYRLPSYFKKNDGAILFKSTVSFFGNPYFADTVERGSVYDCKWLLSFFIAEYIGAVGYGGAESEYKGSLSSAVEAMSETENLREGIDAFVRLSHYSHSHLARMVKKHYGMGLKEFINELRLKAAYRLITLTPRDTTQISEELGFSSFSHFCKIFKARFDITPAALRKNKGIRTI